MPGHALSVEQIAAVNKAAARLARRHTRTSQSVEDIRQLGYLRVLEHMERHPDRTVPDWSCSLMTYYALIDALRSSLPGLRHTARINRLRAKIEARLEHRLLRPPTERELLAAGAPAPVDAHTEVSLEDTQVTSTLAAEVGLDPLEAVDLRKAVARLPARERMVIERIYFQGETARTLLTAMGVSESRISSLHRTALRRLRVMLR